MNKWDLYKHGDSENRTYSMYQSKNVVVRQQEMRNEIVGTFLSRDVEHIIGSLLFC